MPAVPIGAAGFAGSCNIWPHGLLYCRNSRMERELISCFGSFLRWARPCLPALPPFWPRSALKMSTLLLQLRCAPWLCSFSRGSWFSSSALSRASAISPDAHCSSLCFRVWLRAPRGYVIFARCSFLFLGRAQGETQPPRGGRFGADSPGNGSHAAIKTNTGEKTGADRGACFFFMRGEVGALGIVRLRKFCYNVVSML